MHHLSDKSISPMSWKKIARRVSALLVAITLSFTFSPFSGTSNGTVGVQQACADGSCCPLARAVCGLNGENYQDKEYTSGSCSGDEKESR
jgi:hypothetical protein